MPPTLEQIRRAFPLSGTFHFRFKSPLVPGGDRERGAMAVWMDCADDRQTVPTWKQTIVAKVTRLGVDDDDDDDDDDEADFERVSEATTMEPLSHKITPQPSYDIFDGPSPAVANPRSSPPQQQQQQQPDLLHTPVVAKDDLLNMNHGFGQQQQQETHDFFGMTHSPPDSSTTAHNNNNYGQPYGQHQQQQQPFGQGAHQHSFGQQQQQPQAGYGQQTQPTKPADAFDQFQQTKGPFGDLGVFN
jgi:hypothetical protein